SPVCRFQLSQPTSPMVTIAAKTRMRRRLFMGLLTPRLDSPAGQKFFTQTGVDHYRTGDLPFRKTLTRLKNLSHLALESGQRVAAGQGFVRTGEFGHGVERMDG